MTPLTTGCAHWTKKQHAALQAAIKAKATLAYWCSDAHGRPANGGTHDGWCAKPGLRQKIAGPLALCGRGALHATATPHRWAGVRVWVVALLGEVAQDDTKYGALRRTFIGEVLPEEVADPSVGVRLGVRNLRGAYLTRAYLTRAYLTRANLYGANLYGATLTDANLTGADLTNATLRDANLRDANLRDANLTNANLHRANLTDADLTRANLYGANMYGANLTGAVTSITVSPVAGWVITNGVFAKLDEHYANRK